MSDDLGAPDPALVAALAGGDPVAIRTILLDIRVLVPVVATGSDGAGHAAELAVPTLVGADGRRALPVFSGVAALAAWRPGARPVPMTGRQAVEAAADEGCAAIVLDVAGPIPHTVEIREGRLRW
ncbi:MAG TPA: SseB family protein [Mycobacteriales bacterium]|nr:SseB family protein [Mycobacteriales bacterium]